MRTLTILWCALGILVAMVTSAPPDAGSCQFGQQLAESLNQMQGFQGMMAVKCNSTCSSVFCTGRLAIDAVRMKLSFCFGLSLNHCASPANLGYFMHVPSRNITWAGVIKHNDTKALPGPSTPIGQASIIVSTEMVHVNSSLRFGVNASVKLTEGQLELFPYKLTVIPVQTIAVPPCVAGVTQAPPTWPDKCAAPPPPHVTKAPPTIISKSATYHQPCEMGLFQCSPHEMCVLRGALRKGGLCQCQSDAKLSPDTGLCEVAPTQGTIKPPSVVTKTDKHANSQTTSSPNTPATNGTIKPSSVVIKSDKRVHSQTTSTPKSPATNVTVIIACSVVGGILLASIVVSVIICIGRRRRKNRYRDRLQLLTDEDDDDNDTNVVI